MTQPSSGRPIALIVGAFVALAMLAHALPARVEAACGRGSLSKTEREAGLAARRLEVLSMDSSAHQAIPDGPARRPCSGPSCSDGGSSGPNVPVPTSLETGERWLFALICPNITAPGNSRRLPRGASPSPVNCDSARTPTTIPPHLRTGPESFPGLPIPRQNHRFQVLRYGLSWSRHGVTSVTPWHRL